MIVESWNMSTEQELPRHVSRLKDWSQRRKIGSENTYRVFIHERQGVGLCYDGGNIGEYAGDAGDEWESETEFVEDVRRGAEDVAWKR